MCGLEVEVQAVNAPVAFRAVMADGVIYRGNTLRCAIQRVGEADNAQVGDFSVKRVPLRLGLGTWEGAEVGPRLMHPENPETIGFSISLTNDYGEAELGERRYATLFPVPGTYEIWVEFATPEQLFKSNVLRIKVLVQPDGPDSALASIRAMDAFEAMYCPSLRTLRSDGLLREYESFVARHASSPYARYAALTCAEWRLQDAEKAIMVGDPNADAMLDKAQGYLHIATSERFSPHRIDEARRKLQRLEPFAQ
jgi:hypothetical protein